MWGILQLHFNPGGFLQVGVQQKNNILRQFNNKQQKVEIQFTAKFCPE